MGISEDEFKQLLKRRKKENPHLYASVTNEVTEPEQTVLPSLQGQAQVKKIYVGYPFQVSVEIASRRKRLADIDNLCPKFIIDALRYIGILQGDEQDKLKEVICTQEKCWKGEAEQIVIRIYREE